MTTVFNHSPNDQLKTLICCSALHTSGNWCLTAKCFHQLFIKFFLQFSPDFIHQMQNTGDVPVNETSWNFFFEKFYWFFSKAVHLKDFRLQSCPSVFNAKPGESLMFGASEIPVTKNFSIISTVCALESERWEMRFLRICLSRKLLVVLRHYTAPSKTHMAEKVWESRSDTILPFRTKLLDFKFAIGNCFAGIFR